MHDAFPRNGPIAWMAQNSIAANLLMVLFLAGGFLMYDGIVKEFLPDTADELVIVYVGYPGASPDEVERGVVQAIEEAVEGIEGAGEIRSTASQGTGKVTVELISGGNIQQLHQDIKSKVDSIRSFPIDAEEPNVQIASRRRQVLELVLSADAPRTALHELATQARDLLLQTGRITQIDVVGLPKLQVNVDVDPAAMRAHRLTIPEISSRLRTLSVDTPAGSIKGASGEQLVRVRERRDYAHEFAELPIISSSNGALVRLDDIATVREGFADNDRGAWYNGKPAVMLRIYRVGSETPISVAEAVDTHLPEIRAMLPDSGHADVLSSRAESYRGRVQLLLKNGLTGLALVLILLGTFLRARVAFWVMMGIPISFLGAIMLMPAFAATINMVSLFAFIISLGIVVDDAIIVGENIYSYHERGHDWMAAAIRGTRDIAKPITFSVITNIIAFMPLMFVPGPRGKLFWMIPAVAISAFAVSLIESLFVLPAHLAHGDDRPADREGRLDRWRKRTSERLQTFIEHRYAPALDRILAHRRLAPAVALGILLVAIGWFRSGRVGFTAFPPLESDYAFFTAQFPVGSPVKLSTDLADRVIAEAIALGEEIDPELVTGVIAEIGNGGGHAIDVRIFLGDADSREGVISTEDFTDRWRARTGPIIGTRISRFVSNRGGPGSGDAITIQLSHRNPDVLEQASRDVAAELGNFPVVSDINDGTQNGKQQFDVFLKPQARALGLDAVSLARQLRGQFFGIEARRQLRSGDEITILVRGDERTRSNEYGLENSQVLTPGGRWVPLDEVAELRPGRAYTTIRRINGARIVNVTADVTPKPRTSEVVASLDTQVLPRILQTHRGLRYEYGGGQRRDRESLGGLAGNLPLALSAMFALIAISFASYALAGLVMAIIPFGMVGAMLGHIIMGYSFSIPGILGMVALGGVLVNGSLVLLAFAEQRRRDGLEPIAAIRQAAMQRFRPIFLTTFTTFAGLTPMIFETSRQAKFLIPMAISLGFGLLFATVIVLTLLPAWYGLVADRGRLPVLPDPAQDPGAPATD